MKIQIYPLIWYKTMFLMSVTKKGFSYERNSKTIGIKEI